MRLRTKRLGSPNTFSGRRLRPLTKRLNSASKPITARGGIAADVSAGKNRAVRSVPKSFITRDELNAPRCIRAELSSQILNRYGDGRRFGLAPNQKAAQPQP